MADKNGFVTTNYGFAAYLLFLDHKVIEKRSLDKKRWSFKFDLDEEEADKLLSEFEQSAYRRFDNCILSLKRIPLTKE